MFELFFKYSRATFERGELAFASGWPVWLLVALIVAATAAVAVTIARRNQGLGIAKSTALGVLQAALLAALLVLAWRPALVTQTLRPQENSVAVLLDTSASMLYGTGDQSRLQQAIGALTERALPQLESQFDVNLYGFAGDLVDLPSKKLDQVPPPGPVTHIGDAVLDVLRGAQSGAVAAVVLVTDGNDNSSDFDAAKIAEIASFGVPVHTVGVGAESTPGDLELEDVQVAPVGLPGSTVSAQVSIRHDGAGVAQLKVYDGDKILASEPVPLPSGSGIVTRWIDLDVGPVGVRDLKFALDALPGETNTINNARLRPMEVPQQRRSVLYVEGEPRWEYKFIRRAIEEGGAVRVASLLKTTPNKFYRQGVESADELTKGFPEDELTLFRYDALIIGSFEAAALSAEQQDMVREFVSRRGGSLLMLGGRRGLADGGWGATSVAEVLPVELPTPEGPTFTRTAAKARLTQLGRTSAITRLDADDAKNVKSWDELPEIADFQHVGKLKPGAQALLEATIDGKTEPLLVQQSFGNGMSYVFATGGSWRWQMQLPHEDMRHETFWRQLLQAIASTAPQPVTLTSPSVFYGDQSEVTLRAEVRDKLFKPAPDAAVTLSVSDGQGPPREVPMTPVAGEPGVYQAAYETPHAGMFRFEASAQQGDEKLGSAQLAVRRQDGVVEHYHTQQNRPLLERLAAATGGKYFALNDLSKLPEAVSFSEAGTVERQVLDLWNMPIVFLVLLALKSAEWLLRLVWGRL
ncbi:MAG TPA: hypothetical protein VFO94_04600 [Gammaproteobacteria bacterium]|nr:hypothetical protein [Gammaproteobacteria bacterium]